jgi:hypothetical protein
MVRALEQECKIVEQEEIMERLERLEHVIDPRREY